MATQELVTLQRLSDFSENFRKLVIRGDLTKDDLSHTPPGFATAVGLLPKGQTLLQDLQTPWIQLLGRHLKPQQDAPTGPELWTAELRHATEDVLRTNLEDLQEKDKKLVEDIRNKFQEFLESLVKSLSGDLDLLGVINLLWSHWVTPPMGDELGELHRFMQCTQINALRAVLATKNSELNVIIDETQRLVHATRHSKERLTSCHLLRAPIWDALHRSLDGWDSTLLRRLYLDALVQQHEKISQNYGLLKDRFALAMIGAILTPDQTPIDPVFKAAAKLYWTPIGAIHKCYNPIKERLGNVAKLLSQLGKGDFMVDPHPDMLATLQAMAETVTSPDASGLFDRERVKAAFITPRSLSDTESKDGSMQGTPQKGAPPKTGDSQGPAADGGKKEKEDRVAVNHADLTSKTAGKSSGGKKFLLKHLEQMKVDTSLLSFMDLSNIVTLIHPRLDPASLAERTTAIVTKLQTSGVSGFMTTGPPTKLQELVTDTETLTNRIVSNKWNWRDIQWKFLNHFGHTDATTRDFVEGDGGNVSANLTVDQYFCAIRDIYRLLNNDEQAADSNADLRVNRALAAFFGAANFATLRTAACLIQSISTTATPSRDSFREALLQRIPTAGASTAHRGLPTFGAILATFGNSGGNTTGNGANFKAPTHHVAINAMNKGDSSWDDLGSSACTICGRKEFRRLKLLPHTTSACSYKDDKDARLASLRKRVGQSGKRGSPQPKGDTTRKGTKRDATDSSGGTDANKRPKSLNARMTKIENSLEKLLAGMAKQGNE